MKAHFILYVTNQLAFTDGLVPGLSCYNLSLAHNSSAKASSFSPAARFKT